MTRMIEPAGADSPEGPATLTGAGTDPSLIPSVAGHAGGGSGKAAKIIFTVAGVAVVCAMLFAVWRVMHRPPPQQAKVAPQAPVAAASGSVKRLDMPPAPPLVASDDPAGLGAPHDGMPAVPAIEGGKTHPINVRGTVPRAGQSHLAAVSLIQASEDAPVLLTRPANVPTTAMMAGQGGSADLFSDVRTSLAQYRGQLEQTLSAMKTGAPSAPAAVGAVAPVAAVAGLPATGAATAAAGGTPGAQRGALGLSASDLPTAYADVLGNRSLMLPAGRTMTCALTTKIVAAQSGFVSCRVARDVYSADGKVVLIERGSTLNGEYRMTQVRPGTVKVPVLWTRILTPGGVTVNLDSPATGALGESGVDAFVDNRWLERVGAALLVSVIDDGLAIAVNNSTAPSQGSNTVVFQGTSQTASRMAEKILDNTINLPPILYTNQGALAGVYVARDVDFSTVYELKPKVE